MEKIKLEQVSYTYQEHNHTCHALTNINFSVKEGEFVVLAGKSGCGKSTLLHLLAGLTMPSSGNITIDGSKVTGPAVNRGIVFQNYSLFPFLTARKNILFGIRQAQKNLSRQEADKLADHFLKQVGLWEYQNYYPYQMSGGMQQRTAIARMLAMDAEILLLDEPFGALDPHLRLELQVLLEKLWKSGNKKKTIIFVTHDVDEALTLADRILFLSNQTITAELSVPFERPRGINTLLQEDSFCQLRKQLISLYEEIPGKEGSHEKKCGCC